MEDFSSFFPKGTDLFRIFGNLKSVGNGKCDFLLFRGFFGFFQWVYREGDDVYVFLPEFFQS